MDLAQRLAAARGDRPADLLLTNLRLVNVFNGQIERTSIAIAGGLIVGVGDGYTAAEVVDLGGRYVAPGLIDAHVHIESSMSTPPEFGRALLAHGVTTAITDPHEIANVFGLRGIRFMLDAARGRPLSTFVMASSCVPATGLESAGAELDAADLRALLDDPAVLGLAEVMNYPGVIAGDPAVLAKLDAYRGRPLDGHAPDVRGQRLNAYLTAGIQSDHECTTVDEAREKLAKGLVIFIREATNARNLGPLLDLITPQTAHRICLCTDDRQPSDLLDQGSIDYMLRAAIAGGVDPQLAIRMATLNPADYFGLRDRGAVGPGRRADLIIFSDLAAPRAELVYAGGRRVAQDGVMVVPVQGADAGALPPSVNIDWAGVSFEIPASSPRIRVIGAIPDQLITEVRVLDAALAAGCAVADPARDLLKMAVIERHHATGRMGRGFIQGFGLRHGAIAGTVAHDHHNLVVIGADDTSLGTAVRAVEQMGGGLVAVSGEQVLAQLPLPVGGLMSTAPIEEVRAGLDRLLAAARHDLGATLRDPFMAMSFMALEVIPHLKLTDRGLVDVDRFEIVELFV